MYNSVKLTTFNKLKPICYFQHSRSHEVKKLNYLTTFASALDESKPPCDACGRIVNSTSK